MSKVLLVDTNFSSGPIYQYLIQAGHLVYVIGGNPKDFLAKCVDNYANFDYTDLDKTREFIADKQIDFIIPGCNDRSYFVCAELNRDGRYPGIDTIKATETINNKEHFRSFATKHGLPVPKVFAEAEIGTRWPVIVKPVDAYSGRGVSIIQEKQKEELLAAIKLAREFSPTQTCVVEEYVEGQLYSHTAFISQGEVVVDYIVEEHGTANRFVVDTSRVIYDFPNTISSRLRENIQILARALQLKDGLVHTQFIIKDNDYWIIEITRRCPGDLYSELIELSTGLNYAENYTRPFLNAPFHFEFENEQKWIMRHTISQPIQHIFGSIQFHAPIKIEKLVPISLAGDVLKPSPYGRIAILFAKTNNKAELTDLFTKTLNRELYAISA
jgi:glutathione synthase/RimK-type ligase-like ATP-grasp enzyme